MGLTLHDALVIQNNENVKVYPFRERGAKKFGFEIGYMERDSYRLLLSSKAVYCSKKEAESAGKDIVREVKGIDLGEHLKKLQAMIPEQEREAVGKIIEASRK